MKTVLVALAAASQLFFGPGASPTRPPPASTAGLVGLQRASIAVVVATIVADDTRQCAGADGTYLTLDIRIQGPITSADPRLSGNLAGHVQAVIKEQPGLDFLIGAGRDDYDVHDPQGALKLSGTAFFAADGLKALKAFTYARLADGSTLVSSLNGLNALIAAEETARQLGLGGLVGHLPFIVELAGPVSFNPTDQGVIQTGSCPGGFDPSSLVPSH